MRLRRSVATRVNSSGFRDNPGQSQVETLKRRAIEPLSVEDRSALALHKLFGGSVGLAVQQEKASVDPTSSCNSQSSHMFMRLRTNWLQRHDAAEGCNAAERSGDHGPGGRHLQSQQQVLGDWQGIGMKIVHEWFFNVVSYKRNAQPKNTVHLYHFSD
jgi:hypothetical protein